MCYDENMKTEKEEIQFIILKSRENHLDYIINYLK